jgi:hypothetical protein
MDSGTFLRGIWQLFVAEKGGFQRFFCRILSDGDFITFGLFLRSKSGKTQHSKKKQL